MLFRTVCIQNKPYPIHIQLVNLGVRIFYCLSLFHRIRLVYALFCLDAVFSNAFSGSYREINAFFDKIVLPLLWYMCAHEHNEKRTQTEIPRLKASSDEIIWKWKINTIHAIYIYIDWYACSACQPDDFAFMHILATCKISSMSLILHLNVESQEAFN